MKLIKDDYVKTNLIQVLCDHRLSWRAKGIYADLISLPNRSCVDEIELSTHASDGLDEFKAGLNQLRRTGYLVINNKLLIIKTLSDPKRSLSSTGASNPMVNRHERNFASEMLRNQWLIVWHRDDAAVVKALVKLADYLNPEMVLYGIQCSKQRCHSYRESLPYLNRLIMTWKRHHLSSIGQTQRWMNRRKLSTKPWNSETQDRIFSSRHRQMLNNTPLNRGIPDVFKRNHK